MDYNFEIIDKEKISGLTFPKTNVLDDDKEVTKQLRKELDRALILGNLEHVKVKIYFEDDTSKKVVDTTIWGVTEERIILKQGVVIPIKRIYKIT